MNIKRKSVFAVILALILVIPLLLTVSAENFFKSEERISIVPISEESRRVVIASAEGSDFSLYYSVDSIQADQNTAKQIEKTIRETFGIRVAAKPDTVAANDEFEILIGNIQRSELQEFYAKLLETAPSEEDIVWGYAYINGKLIFVGNCEVAYKLGQDEFLTYLSEKNYTVPSDLSVMRLKLRAEYDEEVRIEIEQNRQKYIEELKVRNEEFSQDDFGGDAPKMPEGLYNSPYAYPTANQHPRCFLIEEDLDEIIYNFSQNPDYSYIANQIRAYADKVRGHEYTGIFPDGIDRFGEACRWDVDMVAQLEAKAFMYLMTGDASYGYEAIIGAKNAMLSIKFTRGFAADVYHGPSMLMVTVAKVYDWCYDLLSDNDKNQIIAGVANVLAPQLEAGMQFPPTGMNALSGHGTGPQFIRDWMTVAIVFYDEMPSWWELVGGRFYQQYVPVIDAAHQSGWCTQGTTTYGDSKYFTKSWAAYMVQIATGEFPYDYEEFKKGAYYYFSYIQPNKRSFQFGDGQRLYNGGDAIDSCAYMMLAALLFDDPVMGAMAREFTNNYTIFSYDDTTEMTAPVMLIFRTLGPDIGEKTVADIGAIQYFEAPAGSMTARTSWNEDAAAVVMRMGTLTMAAHDNYDHGTFQIYYKGLLAGTSGAYLHYGSSVHKYYLQATVSQNGLLVFNPALADEAPVWDCTKDHEHSLRTCEISNGDRYFYSGSQRARTSPSNIETWLSGEYEMGEMLGASYEYNRDGTPKYAYIAADLTKAYPSDEVEYLSRRMFTLFTGDEVMPMLFFTYDTITSTDPSFTKTFLLHTVKEPLIDEEKLTAVAVEGEGRLVMHSLSGAQSITKIGGQGKDFWINGKNCEDAYTNADAYWNKIWGRVELTTSGNLTDHLFTAMYVTDADSTAMIELESFKTDVVEYAKALDNFIAFANIKTDLQSKEFTFTTAGKGLYNYYISGLETGSWIISVDGMRVATVLSDEGEGFVSFTAPAGEVILTPGDDVIGANGGRIKYNTFGGIMPDGYPVVYKNDQLTPLPTAIVKENCKFLGWYLSPNYEPETYVEELPMGLTGTVNVYAKWLGSLLSIDYTGTAHATINVIGGGNKNVNGIAYNPNNGAGGSFVSTAEEDGSRYLAWTMGAASSYFTVSNLDQNYATMTAEDECASFTVTFAKNGDVPTPKTEFRVYSRHNPSGASAISRLYVFTTNPEGEIRLGNSTSGPIAGMISDKPITLRIVLDFKNSELRAYDAYGGITASTEISVSQFTGTNPGVNTVAEWRALLDEVIFYWVNQESDPTASFKVYGINIDEGDRFVDLEPVDGMIVYNLNGGGTLTADKPIFYSKESPTELPIPTPEMENIFLGWYTTPEFKDGTQITEVPVDTTGILDVYARWSTGVISENYSDTVIDISKGNVKTNEITYNINSSQNSFFTTKTDDDGKPYLEWHDGTGGTGNRQPYVYMNNGAIAESQDPAISYELVFSKNGDEPLQTFYMRTYAQHDVNGNRIGKTNDIILFKVIDDGIYLTDNNVTSVQPTDVKIGEITDGKISIRVVLDFASCEVKAYAEDGTVYAIPFAIPESSGATTGIEFQKTFQTYVFYLMSTTSNDVPDTSVRIHKIKIDSGNIFAESEALNGTLVYMPDGGKLPADAPEKYLLDAPTPLPIPKKENSIFRGWYTDPDFEPSTKLSEIPAGTKGIVTLYAKWSSNLVTEDYTETELKLVQPQNTTKNGMVYYTNSAANASFTTKEDENGEKYLEWIDGGGSNNPYIIMKSDAIAKAADHQISYEFVFSKNGDEPLMEFYMRTLAQNDVNGNSLSSSNSVYLFKILEEGIFLADNNSTEVTETDIKLGDITDGKMRVRIVLDFEECKVKAYTESGEVVSLDLAIPESSGAKTGIQFQKTFMTYVFYMMSITPADVLNTSVRIHEIKIDTGNVFEASYASE